MRVAVFGAGAMGISLAALMTPYAEIDLIARNAARAEELGSVLFNGKPVSLRVRVAEGAGEYDLVILAVKQRDTESAVPALRALLGKAGALMSIQNGLPEAGLAEQFGGERVYGCTVSYGAERTQDGVAVTSQAGIHFAVGAYGGGCALGEISSLLSKVGEVYVGDLCEIRFAKLAVNASFSTLSALSGLTFGQISHKYKREAVALMREVFSVARAYGCRRLPLNGHDLFRVFGAFAFLTVPVAMRKYRNTRSGMLLDLEAGRRCDVDLVAGACVAAGRKKGVETPLLARAVSLVHDVENGLAEIAPQTIGLVFGGEICG